jgi:hypothetical protein
LFTEFIVVAFEIIGYAILVNMDQWTVQHRAFVIEAFFKNSESVTVTQRLFRNNFHIPRHGRVPCRNTIKQWVSNFRNTASALKVKPTGRPRSVRTPENVERVRESVLQSPKRSARRQCVALAVSRASMHRILHLDLNFHPYKIAVVQKLNDTDPEFRLASCQRLLQLVNEENILQCLVMSDEAHFELTGNVNCQNCRYWSRENPNEIHQRPLHSEKVTVWCGVARFGVIGPFFFENQTGTTVTVNAERYVDMIQNFLVTRLQQLGIEMDSVWFQQDGATAHTANLSMNALRDLFPGHLISRFGDVAWPARSPDLNACDFWLWGYLKSKVFVTKPNTIAQLKNCIRNEVAAIPMAMIRRVMANFVKRLNTCVEIGGGHLSDVIFHK